MKKLLIGLFALAFLFTGCTKKAETDKNDTNNNDTNNNSTNNNTTGNNDNNLVDDVKDTFTSFEASLTNAGIEISDKAENFAEKIGAKEGYKYNSDQGYIEIYYFEDEDALRTIKSDKKVTIDGKEYPVSVNGNWVLFTNDLAYENDVTNIFNKLK